MPVFIWNESPTQYETIFLREEKALFHVPFWAKVLSKKMAETKFLTFRYVIVWCLVWLISHWWLEPSVSSVLSRLDPKYLLWNIQKWRCPKSMSLCTCAHISLFKHYHENTSSLQIFTMHSNALVISASTGNAMMGLHKSVHALVTWNSSRSV